MAKLKCDLHKKRVVTVNGKFLHRGGWGETCSTKTATIGDFTGTAKEIENGGRQEAKVFDPAKKLVKDIFSGKSDG